MITIDSKALRAELLATGALTPGERYVPPTPAPRLAGVLRLDDAAREAVEVHRHERGEVPDFDLHGRTYVLSRRGELRRKTLRTNRSRS